MGSENPMWIVSEISDWHKIFIANFLKSGQCKFALFIQRNCIFWFKIILLQILAKIGAHFMVVMIDNMLFEVEKKSLKIYKNANSAFFDLTWSFSTLTPEAAHCCRSDSGTDLAACLTWLTILILNQYLIQIQPVSWITEPIRLVIHVKAYL